MAKTQLLRLPTGVPLREPQTQLRPRQLPRRGDGDGHRLLGRRRAKRITVPTRRTRFLLLRRRPRAQGRRGCQRKVRAGWHRQHHLINQGPACKNDKDTCKFDHLPPLKKADLEKLKKPERGKSKTRQRSASGTTKKENTTGAAARRFQSIAGPICRAVRASMRRLVQARSASSTISQSRV